MFCGVFVLNVLQLDRAPISIVGNRQQGEELVVQYSRGLFLLKIFICLFIREREREREREGEKHRWVASCTCPDGGPNLQPRCVP